MKNWHTLSVKKPFQASNLDKSWDLSVLKMRTFIQSHFLSLLLMLLADADWLSLDARQREQNNIVQTQMNVIPIVVNVIFNAVIDGICNVP